MSQRVWSTRVLVAIAAALALLAGCSGPEDEPPPRPAPPAEPRQPPPPAPPPAEPGDAPPAAADVSGTITSLPGGSPEGAVFDPSTDTLAVALRDPDRVALLDTESGRTQTVPAPGAARHLVLAGPGQLLLLGENSDTVVRMRLPNGEIDAQIPVGRQPHDAAQSGATIFVTNEFSGSVGVIRDAAMVRELPGLIQPGGIAAAGGRVAAVDVRGNNLHVFDATTLREVAVLPAGRGPSHVRSIGQGRVVVADTRGNALYSYQITGDPRQLGQATLPGRAYGLAGDPDRGLVYTTLANTNQVASLRALPDGNLTEVRSVNTVSQPNDVAVDPRSGTVYVIGQGQAQVQALTPSSFGD